jgi:Mn2+/Fe2+ NRAMP family transporter
MSSAVHPTTDIAKILRHVRFVPNSEVAWWHRGMQEIPRAQAGSLLQRLWRGLGPGLVTGAADDDPSGIATHSQIGAQFGYALSWTFVLSFPLMVVIQEVAAQIGCVTGRGIAHNLRRHYSPWFARELVTK